MVNLLLNIFVYFSTRNVLQDGHDRCLIVEIENFILMINDKKIKKDTPRV